MCEFPRVLGWKPQTKMGPYCKIYKKTILAHEFWGDNQYFQSLRPRTAFQWHRACYFLWCTILALGGGGGGAQFSFGGGTSSDLGGTAPKCPRGAGPVENTCACVLGLEHSFPWPRKGLSSEGLSLASEFFCVLDHGLEPGGLDSTSDTHCILNAVGLSIS